MAELLGQGNAVDAGAHKEKGDLADIEAKEEERRRQSVEHAMRVRKSLQQQRDGETQPPLPAAGAEATTAIAEVDLERGNSHRVLPADGSRIGMPKETVNRSQPSLQNFYPSQPSTAHDPNNPNPQPADPNEEDYSWGPSHPCFPHPNPHVPLNSPLAQTTRIIRIKRDWMLHGDLAPTVSNLYPEILDPYLPEEQFRLLIRKLNDELTKAFDPWSFANWVDCAAGVFTLWLWEDIGATRVKRRLRKLEEWLEEWNRSVGAREGVRVISLRRTGYMTLDIQIPDPHVGVEESEQSRPPSVTAVPALTVNGHEQRPSQGENVIPQ